MAFDFWFSYGKPQGMYVNGVPFTMPMERSIVPSGGGNRRVACSNQACGIFYLRFVNVQIAEKFRQA